MKTYREAYERMFEVLTSIGEQFVNKDGMTGGRCVELAQEALEEMKDAKLAGIALGPIASEAERWLLHLAEHVQNGLDTVPTVFKPKTGRGD